MASVNKVIIVGNCGRDPEIRYLPNGQPVANISVATSSRRKDRNSGETIEDTQWHRVTFYDRLAEVAAEYVKKGRPVYVEGRLKYGSYVDRASGVEKSTVEIIATELQLLGGREGSSGGDHPSSSSRPVPSRQTTSQAAGSASRERDDVSQAQEAGGGGGGFSDFEDSIPFANPLRSRALCLAM